MNENDKTKDLAQTGGATLRKKSRADKFIDELSNDITNRVKDYIFYDLGLKGITDFLFGGLNAIYESFTRALDYAIYDGRRRPNRPTGNPTRISYGSYYKQSTPVASYMAPQRPAVEEKNEYSDNEIFISDYDSKSGQKLSPRVTKEKAEDILITLNECIDTCECASVLDLKDKLEESGTPEDDRWGWTEPILTKPRRVTDGYVIDIPNPKPLPKR